MTSRYNPDDYERVFARHDETGCAECVFQHPVGCLVMNDTRFPCRVRIDGDRTDYIYVVKNAKDEKGGK